MKHNLLMVLHHSEQNAPLQHRCTVDNFSLTELEDCMTHFKIGVAAEYWEHYLGHDDFAFGEDTDWGLVQYVGELLIFNPTVFYVDPRTGENKSETFEGDSFECYVPQDKEAETLTRAQVQSWVGERGHDMENGFKSRQYTNVLFLHDYDQDEVQAFYLWSSFLEPLDGWPADSFNWSQDSLQTKARALAEYMPEDWETRK